MRIAIGADHAGFSLKERLKSQLERGGHDVVDVGTDSEVSCDYPDFAAAVAERVASGRADRGVLVCHTGIGMSMAANKVAGVRAAAVENPEAVRLTREHNDANVLAMGARFVDPERAAEMLEIFLKTEFQGGRHSRRIAKIAGMEKAAGEGNS
jgi:ribose 5-phosphate isomerase B